jgi:hypothetical protein
LRLGRDLMRRTSGSETADGPADIDAQEDSGAKY